MFSYKLDGLNADYFHYSTIRIGTDLHLQVGFDLLLDLGILIVITDWTRYWTRINKEVEGRVGEMLYSRGRGDRFSLQQASISTLVVSIL